MNKIGRFFGTVQIKLIIIYVLLILIAMQLIGVYFVRTLESSFVENFSDSLQKQTYLLAEFVEPYLANQQSSSNLQQPEIVDINEMVRKLFTISGAEIQVIDDNGIVLSSSLESHQNFIGKKNTKKEVSRALQGIRLNESMVYDAEGLRKKIIATPVGSGREIFGAIYIEASMEDLYENINRINQIFISGTLIALGLTVLLGVILSHTITAPIKQMRKSATAIADGQFNQFVPVHANDEIGQLADSFNFMTSRLKEALSGIEEEKEKLATVLTHMSDGVVAADEYGRIILMNRQARQMFGYEEEHREIRNLARLLNKSWSAIKEASDRTGFSELMQLPWDEQSTNERQTLRVTFTPVRPKDMTLTGIIAVFQDVTIQQQLEQQRKDFVANVSHELRTPLTTIKSYLEALDEDEAIQDPELAKRFIGVARNETERMIRLVQDLLMLSQLERPAAMLQRKPISVQELLEEVSDRFAFQFQQKDLQFYLKISDQLPTIDADRDQMDQVLDNLLSNAIKFTPAKGRIEITAQQIDEQWIQVRVMDNGIGIPKKDIAFIFDRFYRADKARSRQMGGTGLGLSIAQTIVQAHGGSVSLESDVRSGTMVTFTVPASERGGEADD